MTGGRHMLRCTILLPAPSHESVLFLLAANIAFEAVMRSTCAPSASDREANKLVASLYRDVPMSKA
jgi:hypothetical protein